MITVEVTRGLNLMLKSINYIGKEISLLTNKFYFIFVSQLKLGLFKAILFLMLTN